MHSEYSIASTSQLLDMKEKKWASELIRKAGIDPKLLAPLDYAGKDLGPLRPEIAKEV